MKLNPLHRWELSPVEAIELQKQLAPQVVRKGTVGHVELVAASDVAFVERTRAWVGGRARAAVVLLEYPSLKLIEHHVVESDASFPYVPGLLSFREIPALAGAFERLSGEPDLILVDGHGFAHPRRFGLASHLGLLAGIPTIGCAKSRLHGYASEPSAERGTTSELVDGGQVIGKVVRTKTNVKPLFVSTGHLIGLDEAVEWVLQLAPTHRLPEPIRLADRLSKGHSL